MPIGLLGQIRAYKRKHNLKITSFFIGLSKYSEVDYKIYLANQNIIRQNKLSKFDY